MTTASILLTVGTAWSAASDKCKEGPLTWAAPVDVVAVAARELRETPAVREQALRHMREWLSRNADVSHVRVDDNFLLRFLRQKKYSIPMAQQTLLKYLNLRKYYPEMSKGLDCEDPKLKELLDTGYIVVSPLRDDHGRRVIIYNMALFDPNKFGCWDMSRVHYLIYESLLEDSDDQVLGFTHVGDGNGVSGSHVVSWNPIDFARLMKWGEQSVPMRHKEIHVFNIPTAIKYVLDFACSKVSQKMNNRLHIHTNVKSLHKKVASSCLPSNYGGTVSLQEMITHTRQIVNAQRQRVLALDDMEILSTRGIQSSRNKSTCSTQPDVASVQGSFRKLEID